MCVLYACAVVNMYAMYVPYMNACMCNYVWIYVSCVNVCVPGGSVYECLRTCVCHV